jgi:hypothetical protein
MPKPYTPPLKAPTPPDHLAAIPSPLTTHGHGYAWMPPRALKARWARDADEAARRSARPMTDAEAQPPADMLAAAGATWAAYRAALTRAALDAVDRRRAAMTPGERLDDMPGAPAVSIGRAVSLGETLDADLVLTAYHRARLGAYTAALGDPGRDLFRIQRADMAFAAALARKTRGAITPDLCPDLPRRLDLTDDAVDAVRDFERGAITWRRLQKRLEPAAKAAVREALDDMGWHHGMAAD